MGEQSDTLVRNMLKRHKGNVKKAADQIMKDNPGMFDVNRMMMDDVQNEESQIFYKRPASVSALGGQKFHAIVDGRGMIIAAGMTEKDAKKKKKFGQKVMELPGAKIGQKIKMVKEDVEQVDESRDDFDYLDIQAAMQDAKLEAPKVVKTRNGFQVMVYSRKVKKFIPQGQPHKTKAAAEKDAKMFEDVDLDESSLPAYDARLLRQALVLGKNAFKAGKKREPIKDPNLVKLKGFATGKGKNEVMKQWLKGWDEMNLKDDVQIDEATKMGLKDLSQGARTILASAINMSMKGVPGMDSPAANEKNLGKFSESDYDRAIEYLKKSQNNMTAAGKKYAREVSKKVGLKNLNPRYKAGELDESFEFEFPTKAIAQKFMREISQEKLGSSIGTSDGKVTTTTNSGRVGEPTMSHMKMARIMKRYSGKLVRTTEGPKMAKIFEEVELDEKRHSKMSAKDHFNKMVAQGKVGRGGRLVTPIDRDRFPNREREGLEGPFRTKKTGLIYYYDRKAGKYYDPQSDMYLDVNDIMEVVNEEVNLMREEVKTMDQKKAKQVYDKLKKGSEIEVVFGNFISAGGKAITLRVTSGHRIVGASKVGRIILINPENPRGMKYKLFNRDGKISLAQSDMATILKDMKIIKEDVDQVDEKEFKPHKMYHPETGEEVDANTKADHLRFSKMGYKHDKPTK
jgi:hypothetical protein